MKKTLFLIPLVLVLVSCKKKDDPLKYEKNTKNNYTAILEVGSTVKKVSVPKKHDGVIVDSISGFRNNSYIEEVTLSSNVTTIEDGTFMFCENLKKVKIDNNYYQTKNGTLMKNDNIIIYFSGRTDSEVTVNKTINSKAFTLAPNIKTLNIESITVNDDAIYFLENLETIYIGKSTRYLSNNFQVGNAKLEKIVIESTKFTETMDIKDVNKVYVLETATLSEAFLSNYGYKNTDTYKGVTYKVYEVK